MTDTTPLAVELTRLIEIYGANAVREEAKRACKGKAGRKEERDLFRLMTDLEQDARDWLDGHDPKEIRANNSIASRLSSQNPGQSPSSTHRRLMRKLSAHREDWYRLKAFWISERERPFLDYFRVAEEAAGYAPAARQLADLHRGKLERYRRLHGEPAASMTILEIAREADLVPRNTESNRKFENVLANIFEGKVTK